HRPRSRGEAAICPDPVRARPGVPPPPRPAHGRVRDVLPDRQRPGLRKVRRLLAHGTLSALALAAPEGALGRPPPAARLALRPHRPQPLPPIWPPRDLLDPNAGDRRPVPALTLDRLGSSGKGYLCTKLHCDRASFETRPSGAPQDEEG